MKKLYLFLTLSSFFLAGGILLNKIHNFQNVSYIETNASEVKDNDGDKEKKEDNESSTDNGVIIGASLVGVTGVGAGIAVFNNKRKKENEPSKTISLDPDGPTDKTEDFKIDG